MANVTCRCGETLRVSSSGGPDRVECPKCGARIRLRRKAEAGPSPGATEGASDSDDGYVRFHCPCGRRLKVRSGGGPKAGKCPDCGRLVPVPGSGGAGGSRSGRADPDAKTEDLDAGDLAVLAAWSERHTGRPLADANGPDDTPRGVPHVRVTPRNADETEPPATSMVSFEAGLRVCPRCGKPVHISATSCRECGAAVPRR